MRPKEMRNIILYNGLLLIAALLLARIDLGGGAARNAVIAVLGFGSANVLFAALWALLGVLMVAGNLWLLRRARASKSPGQHTPIQTGGAQLPDAVAVRATLRRMQRDHVSLQDLLQWGLEQLDSMDEKHFQAREIRSWNRYPFFRQVSMALDDAEQALCKNLVSLISIATLYAPQKPQAKAHREAMEALLEQNDGLLGQADSLLSETVLYAGELDQGREGGQSLAAMQQVIEALRRENHAGEDPADRSSS